MDYISDMSSEARPRSLPAVVVKAASQGRRACEPGVEGRLLLGWWGEG